MKLIDADKLRDTLIADWSCRYDDSPDLYRLTDGAFVVVDAAQPILCRTCRWMETVYRDDDSLNAYDRCGMVLNPVYPQRVDPDRFGCVCHEVTE